MDVGNPVSGTSGLHPYVPDGRIQRRTTVFDVVRWAMLVVWIVVMAVAVTIGSRTSHLSDLESELSTGSVTSVRITPGMPSGAEGANTQSVFWRDGLLNHRADVVMITPGSNSSASSFDDTVAIRSGYDIAEQIADQQPRVQISRVPEILSYAEAFGFQLPMWMAWFTLVGAAGTFLVLVAGPEPWHATRWAWFWIMSTGIGPPLFLILSGPTPPLPAPRHRHRRLTGGWAFVIALLIQAVLKR